MTSSCTERCHQPEVCSQLQFEFRIHDDLKMLRLNATAGANPKVLMLRVVPFFSALDV